MVTIPSKGTHAVGLALTEASLGEVWRYVLIYMPGSVILLGLLVLHRRRINDAVRTSSQDRARRRRRPRRPKRGSGKSRPDRSQP
jgi:nitrate reductase gamma subunit